MKLLTPPAKSNYEITRVENWFLVEWSDKRLKETCLVNSIQKILGPLLCERPVGGETFVSVSNWERVEWVGPRLLRPKMRRRKRIVISVVVLAILLALGLAVILRKSAPPEAARLLPEADGYIYLNLKPLQRANLLEKLPPVVLDSEYADFVRQTGFQPEKDLEEAAFAIHYPPALGPLPGQNSPRTPPPPPRYSEIFVAHYDQGRLNQYIRKLAKSVDNYENHQILNVPYENRTVRVCFLGPELIAISNVDDPNDIRGMIDRYRHIAMPFRGAGLLREYYRRVPLLSLAWLIVRSPSGGSTGPEIPISNGLSFPLPKDTVLVGSTRYITSIELRAQAITPDQDSAKRVSDQLTTFLTIFRGLESEAGGGDPDVKAFFSSVRVEQSGNTAELTATLPKGFLKKILTEPPVESAAPQPSKQSPAPQPKSQKK